MMYKKSRGSRRKNESLNKELKELNESDWEDIDSDEDESEEKIRV